MIPSTLLVVTDRLGSRRPLIATVRAAIEGGARWIWLRDKDMEPAKRRDLASALLAVARQTGTRLTIGADLDLAAEIGADGVHLSNSAGKEAEGVASLARRGLSDAVANARRRLRHDALVGFSAHGLPDVQAAAEARADYVTLSPIFATTSKPGYGPALGLDGLRSARRCDVPILALGGVGPGEARSCIEAGAAGVAVMGGLMRAADPVRETRRLVEALREHAKS